MRRRCVIVTVAAGCALIALDVAMVDWSPTALVDPARVIGLSPAGSQSVTRQSCVVAFSPFELITFLTIGVAFVATGVLTSRRRRETNIGPLLTPAGLVWLVGGLRRSSALQLMTISGDGVGGATPSSNSGLTGVLDRGAPQNGFLDIISPRGPGTAIIPRPPLHAHPGTSR